MKFVNKALVIALASSAPVSAKQKSKADRNLQFGSIFGGSDNETSLLGGITDTVGGAIGDLNVSLPSLDGLNVSLPSLPSADGLNISLPSVDGIVNATQDFVAGAVNATQDFVAGAVNATSNLLPDLNGTLDGFMPEGGLGPVIPGDETDACSAGTDCTSCLSTEGCSWSPDAGECLTDCMWIADASCYDGATYDASICQEISVPSACGESTDCESCLANEEYCTWFQTDGFTGYCQTGCGMEGCGATVCPSDLDTCEDCLGGDETPAAGQYSWSPDANECLAGCNVIADAACYDPSRYDSSVCEETLVSPDETETTEAESVDITIEEDETDAEETDTEVETEVDAVEEGGSAAHTQFISTCASIVSIGLLLNAF